jgi:hypothetical protein
MRNLSVLDMISKSQPDNVRWEKVKQFKLILTKGTHLVPPEEVAKRLIERMLERGRRLLLVTAFRQSGRGDVDLKDGSSERLACIRSERQEDLS